MFFPNSINDFSLINISSTTIMASPAKFSTKIVHFMYVYSENPSEKRFIADNDNHETKYVQDAITMFLPNGDSPFCCSTYSSAIMTNEISEGTYLTITTEENGILPSEMIVDYWKKCT